MFYRDPQMETDMLVERVKRPCYEETGLDKHPKGIRSDRAFDKSLGY